jgi:trans-aconitate methyltransferase
VTDATHWRRVYGSREPESLSWHQAEPVVSLELIDALGVRPDEAVVDVGGGSSTLVDRLLDRGFADIAVLDVAPAALDRARARLGPRAGEVAWIAEDVLSWRPARHYDVWHDRLLLHFLVDEPARRRYAETLRRVVAPGGSVVIATFAPDGPATCSGLPVRRHDAASIVALLAPGTELVAERREEHVTPAGRVQPLTWIAARVPA